MRKEMLKFIVESTEENGFPPTVREIQAALRMGSPSIVSYHLDILVRDGYVARVPRKNRTLRVTELGMEQLEDFAQSAERK